MNSLIKLDKINMRVINAGRDFVWKQGAVYQKSDTWTGSSGREAHRRKGENDDPVKTGQ